METNSSLLSAAKNGINSFVGGLPTAVGSSLLSSAVGHAANVSNSKRQYDYEKKLMEQQHAYELENMSKQDQYQRNLAKDTMSLRKQALQQAGYSTADPEQAGTIAPTVSGPSTSVSGSVGLAQQPIDYGNLASNAQSSAVTRLQEIEAAFRADKLKSEIDKTKIDIKVAKDMLPKNIAKIDAQINDLVASKDLKLDQAKNISELTNKIKVEIEGIDIDNRYKPKLNDRQIKKLDKEIYKLSQEGKFEAVKAKLSEVGIIVGADWMTQLAAVVHQGTASQLIDEICNMVKDVFSSIGDHGASFIDSFLEGIKDDKKFKEHTDSVLTDYNIKNARRQDSLFWSDK